jgi:hypothetical protein
VYSATLILSNENTQVRQTRPFNLSVGLSSVQNGGFETGDFTDWSLVGDTVFWDPPYGYIVYNAAVDSSFSPDVDYVHSGTYGAALGEPGYLATLSQSLGTVPGQAYLLSFWLLNPTNLPTQIFSVNWSSNGSAMTTLYGITNTPAFAWSNLCFVITPTSTNSLLQFAVENDQNCFGLDDVSLTPLPQPSITSVASTSNQLALSWYSLPNVSYLVQYQTNLTATNWINLYTNTASGGTNSFTNGIGSDPQRFFRVLRLP